MSMQFWIHCLKMTETIKQVRNHFNSANYSRDRWKTHSESSYSLIPWLQEQEADLILDIGCGTNPYKEHVNNLIGMDAANYPEADLNMAAEEVKDAGIFQDNCADVVMALGSINFGDWDNVLNQLEICIDWCKPGGYIVCRARLNDHTELNLKKGFVQYGWKVEDIYTATEIFSDKVELYREPVVETAAGGAKRINGNHGSPDHDRKINLAVWYWKHK